MIFLACASISRPGVSLLEIDIWLDCSYTNYYKSHKGLPLLILMDIFNTVRLGRDSRCFAF